MRDKDATLHLQSMVADLLSFIVKERQDMVHQKASNSSRERPRGRVGLSGEYMHISRTFSKK
jgi:hypothetical protein